MGKLLCICNYIMSTTCGEDGEAFKYDDDDYISEAGFECYKAGDGLSIMECPRCGTLAIDDPHRQKGYVLYYKPENGKYNKLFHDHEFVKGNFSNES